MSILKWLEPKEAVLQNAATSNGNGTVLDLDSGYGTLAIQVTGTFSATINFEVSLNGADYVPIKTTTVTGVYEIPVAGVYKFRARISGYASGSVTVKAVALAITSGTPNAESVPGTVFPTRAIQIAGNNGANLVVPIVHTFGNGDNQNNSNAALATWSMLAAYNASTSQFDRLRVDSSKNLLVSLAGVTGNGIASDNFANDSSGLHANNRNLAFNGTNWDRIRNNLEGNLLASATRTASTNSANQTNYNARGVVLYLNITAASGTGGLQVFITGLDSTSGNNISMNSAPATFTTTGIKLIMLYPGLATVNNNAQYIINAILPRVWYARVYHGDSSNYTYSLGYSLIV